MIYCGVNSLVPAVIVELPSHKGTREEEERDVEEYFCISNLPVYSLFPRYLYVGNENLVYFFLLDKENLKMNSYLF